MTPRRKTRNKSSIFLIGFILICVGIITYAGVYFYRQIFAPNVNFTSDHYLYLPKGSSFDDLVRILEQEQLVDDINSFKNSSTILKFKSIKPGRYKIKPGMSNHEIINKLKLGEQDAVVLTFNNIRTIPEFVEEIGPKFEFGTSKLLSTLSDQQYIESLGFNKDNIISIFIPNTYEIFWTIDEKKFVERMLKEYNNFWNEKRLAKATAIQLSQAQVMTLASIVFQETKKNDEMPRVAGVYMNRLKKNMKLEADPTVIFALNDFSIKRVLSKYLNFDSPYNTYKYVGLPPGPICMPSISAIDAVLNYEQHNYIFFCAKEDFSGYHNFATTMSAHKENARKFQRALNQRRIYK
jgi:UPF0755 protein